jgi:hypothetical protein
MLGMTSFLVFLICALVSGYIPVVLAVSAVRLIAASAVWWAVRRRVQIVCGLTVWDVLGW